MFLFLFYNLEKDMYKYVYNPINIKGIYTFEKVILEVKLVERF